MEYYKERNGLLEHTDSIDEKKLTHYWLEIYKYFNAKGYFKLAETGVKQGNNARELKFTPSPAQYFLLHLGKNDMWPMEENIDKYTVEDIFTVIEIYYAEIASCKWEENEDGVCDWTIERDEPKQEYATFVNNILRLYKEGFYLQPTLGTIISTPNEALRHQLDDRHSEVPSDIFDRLSSASRDFYRFDSTEERKRKAITSLADILEPIRKNLELTFKNEFNLGKAYNDKLIFEMVNKYFIRHDRNDQIKEYSKEIWYDWMMQYYTSTIIAYYKLQAKIEQKKLEEEF